MRPRADDSVNRWRDFGPASGFDIDFLQCSTRLHPFASVPTPGRLLRKSGLTLAGPTSPSGAEPHSALSAPDCII